MSVMTREEIRTEVALAYLALNDAIHCEGAVKAQLILDNLLGPRGTRQRTEALLNAHATIAGRDVA